MTQRLRPKLITLFAGFAVALFEHQMPSAYAGGFDGPSNQYPSFPTQPSKVQGIDSLQSKTVQPLNFNWQQWSQPYQQGDRICREQYGNIVCFTPQTAQKMGWQIRS